MERALFNNKIKKNLTHSLIFEFYGISQTEPGHIFGPCIRDMYIIHFILEGKGIYYVDGKSFLLKKNDIFLIKPNETTVYTSDKKEPWKYGWIAFSGKDVEILLSQTAFSENGYSFSSNNSEKYLQLVLECLKIKSELLSDELQLIEILYRFFRYLLDDGGKYSTIVQKKLSLITLQAIEYVEKNFNQQVKVNEIADSLMIDRSHLSRTFKADMKISLKEWILSIEMNFASHLLVTTDDSIEMIAEKIGYLSTPSFIKIFTKYSTLSPSTFRKKRQKSKFTDIHYEKIQHSLNKLELIQKAT